MTTPKSRLDEIGSLLAVPGEKQIGTFSGLFVEVITRARYLGSKRFVVNFDGGDFSDRAIWRSTRPFEFEDSFDVLKAWYAQCTSEHSLCSAESRPLPTRLLFISNDPGFPLRIIVTEGQVGRYAALSHCWGKTPNNIRTTQDTLKEHLEAINIERLPKTFKDAVLLVRKLELQHLWIDSLCIVQDDEVDWQKEAGKMALVFDNAYITIAATASENSHGGCFFPRDEALHIKLSDSNHTNTSTAYVRYPAEESKSLMRSPLYRRGWALQEMVLSRRIIHFSREQMFWHCRSRITSEDGYFDARLATTLFDLDTPEKAYQSWWTWVEDYSNRELTRPADKFAAFAGLTKSVHRYSGKPIAGLWTDDMHFGLLWCANEACTRSKMDGIPSWSWASLDGPVRTLISRESPVWMDHSNGVIKHAVVLNAAIEWSSTPLTSSILHATLSLRARLNVAVVGEERSQERLTHNFARYSKFNYHKFVKLFFLMPQVSELDDSSRNFSGHCCFDLEPPETSSYVICLLISTASHCGEDCTSTYFVDPKDREGWNLNEGEYWDVNDERKRQFAKSKIGRDCDHQMHHILLLKSTNRVPDEFQRIGVGAIRVTKVGAGLFDDVEEMDITLV